MLRFDVAVWRQIGFSRVSKGYLEEEGKNMKNVLVTNVLIVTVFYSICPQKVRADSGNTGSSKVDIFMSAIFDRGMTSNPEEDGGSLFWLSDVRFVAYRVGNKKPIAATKTDVDGFAKFSLKPGEYYFIPENIKTNLGVLTSAGQIVRIQRQQPTIDFRFEII